MRRDPRPPSRPPSHPPSDPPSGGVTEIHSNAVALTASYKRTATLVWTDDTGPHEVTVDSAATLGSAPSNAAWVAHGSVSRVHAQVEPRDGGIAIRDLGSTNGTFIGTLSVFDVLVRQATRIRLGAVEVEVRLTAAPDDARRWRGDSFGPVLGRSPAMRRLFEKLAQIAPTEGTVLLHGETGTGKDLVARAIHEHSARRDGPFVVIDCGALHAQLLESELFGHARGAFSGATTAHVGAFERATGGTVFLDEIGDSPIDLQLKLLRAIESQTIRRVGETDYRPVDVRIVCASHRDLPAMVNRGDFREDLYFRIAVFPVRVPALRERKGDLPLLVEHIVKQIKGAKMPGMDTMAKLEARSWRGNVRELRNLVVRAGGIGWDSAMGSEVDGDMVRIAFGGGEEVSTGTSKSTATATATGTATATATATGETEDGNGSGKERTYADAKRGWEEEMRKMERAYVTALLQRHNMKTKPAAEEAGIDPRYLRKIRAELGV